MVEFKARRHRLEIPSVPNSDDPAVLKRALDQMKRLVQDEFNRLATDFYDFKQATYNAGIIPLRGVSNLVVTKSEFAMSATWELPDGQEVVPTEVRVRILEISPNSWATYTYPRSSWSFSGLTPGTQYTLQVQLRAVFEATDSFVSTTRNCPSVPVLRTAESPIISKVFTTDAGVGPPTDNGTNDDQVIFTFPDTNGTPGAVSSSDCWWGYKFQYRTACAWADTAVSEAFAAGDVGDVTIDTGNVPFTTHPDTLFRLAYREICDGVPQDWVYGEPFMAVDFSNADCLGISKSASFTTEPYDTADVFFGPGACQEDGTFLQITDELSDTELFPVEPGFKCIEYVDSEWTIFSDDTTNPAISPTIYNPVLQGNVADILNIADDGDFTVAFDVWVEDNSLVLAGGTGNYVIVNIGGTIKFGMVQNTTTYSITATVPRDGGGAYVFRADDLAYGAWNSVYYQHDVSEPDGRKLFVNFILKDQSANAIANDFAGMDSSLVLSLPNDSKMRKIAIWDGLVTPTLTPPDEIGTAIHWWSFNTDFVVATTVIPDIVGTDDLALTAAASGSVTGLDGEEYVDFSTIGSSLLSRYAGTSGDVVDLRLRDATDNTLTFFCIVRPTESNPSTTDQNARYIFTKGNSAISEREYQVTYSGTDWSADGQLSSNIFRSTGALSHTTNFPGIFLPDKVNEWEWFFIELKNDGTDETIKAWEADGTLATTSFDGGSGSGDSTCDEPFFVGRSGASSQMWEGPIAHIIAWDGVLTDDDRADVLAYFETLGWV